MSKMKKTIDTFNSMWTTSDRIWKSAIFILSVFGVTSFTGWAASVSTYFQSLGLLIWIGVGLLAGLIFAFIVYLINLSVLNSSRAKFITSISEPRESINPLESNFENRIIPLSDLDLPDKPIHENKRFSNCTFVGRGTVAIISSNLERTGYIECGHIIPIPNNTVITGAIGFLSCNFISCKFYRTTLMLGEADAEAMRQVPGAKIAGEA